MKKYLLVLTLSIIFYGLQAQIQKNKDGSYYQQCSSFSISKPLRELAEMYPANIENPEIKEAEDSKSNRFQNAKLNPNALPLGDDPIRQKTMGQKVLGAPIVNFDGMTNGWTPPDPSGAVGPNHYVQAVNCVYRVYSKTGTPLINALSLSSLWPGSSDNGDPIVMYDKFADRWFIMQFQTSTNKILIAISKTPDPTGAFYQYTFIPSSSDFPDYPKFSIWSDGYYQTTNFSADKAVVYERAKMLTGDATAGMIVQSIPSVPQSSAFFCAMSFDADGQLPPYGEPNHIIFYEDDAWGTKDQIRLYKWSTDWTAKTATVVLDQLLPTQPFTGIISSGRGDIAQPGTTNKFDALDGLLYYRAPYRRWTGYNSIVVCNVVKLSSGMAGLRWYELRQDDNTKVFSIYQQGTYGPADNLNRYTASIAQDDYGNIAMAYGVSGAATVYPSIRYTGRLASDSLGAMTFAEQTAMTVTSSSSSQRWGDYSQTTIDPTDGITFWHTGEYYSGGQKTRIFSFRLISGTDVNNNIVQQEFIVFKSDNLLSVKANNLASNNKLVVDLFDLEGRLISNKNITPALNKFETSVDVTNLEKGIYLVRIGNTNFQKVIKVLVN